MRSEPSLVGLALLAFAACGGDALILGEGNMRPVGRAPEVDLGAPRVVEALSFEESSDDDPSLSEDRLLLCFNSKRDEGEGAEDIWCASRASTSLPWQAPAALAELNTDARETGIALSVDGLTLWFSSDRDGGDGGLDVYVTARASREAAWSEPTRVPELSSDGDDLVSAIDQAGRTLLLARRDDDDDDYDVWLAERIAATEPWPAPRALDDINSDEEESDAFLVGAGLSLIFTRDEDLLLAQRDRLDAPFDRSAPLESLNSDDDDRDAWANATLSYVIFSSDRDGSHKLYEAER